MCVSDAPVSIFWHDFKEISRFAREKTSRKPDGITSYNIYKGVYFVNQKI